MHMFTLLDSSEVEIILDTPDRDRLNRSPCVVRKKTNGTLSHSKSQWLTTRKRYGESLYIYCLLNVYTKRYGLPVYSVQVVLFTTA